MRVKFFGLLGMTLALGLVAAQPARADEPMPAAVWKFTRGVANILFGLPGEIAAHTLRAPSGSSDSSAANAVTGVLVGTGWGLARMGSGVVDVVTFPVPFEDNKPLVEPEFPL